MIPIAKLKGEAAATSVHFINTIMYAEEGA